MPTWAWIVFGITLLWLCFGVWGYAVSKGLSQSIILKRDWVSKYDREQEVSNRLNILLGPLFLIGMAFLVRETVVYHHIPYLGARFMMPEEFCERRK